MLPSAAAIVGRYQRIDFAWESSCLVRPGWHAILLIWRISSVVGTARPRMASATLQIAPRSFLASSKSSAAIFTVAS
jgi:hypothetical protein